ncbi:MAG: dihydrouridine synthase, partial [Solirubrobacterales bacterium]
LRDGEPTPDEVLAEFEWVCDRASEHFGEEKAGRYLRTFYPWYVDRIGAGKEAHREMQQAEGLAQARAIFAGLVPVPAA